MTQKPQLNKYAKGPDNDQYPSIDDLGQLLEDFGYMESAFHPGQWDATKKKLRELLDQSRSPDIAARMAVALCAPQVAKKRFRADNMGQTPTTAGKIGGNYEAVDHQNGFFSILNIEIFAEVPPGAKRNKERIGEDWMDKAIAKNRLRRKEGFMPPVHIWHSDETAVKPTYAGKFALVKRGTIVYEGREIPAIFANITDIPADVFKRIQSGTLPYRSVEVHDWENPEIDSLALMDTDVPFFRMAMTTIGNVRKQRGPLPIGFKHLMRTPIQFMQQLFTEGAEGRTLGARICFRFEDRKSGGANMATDISTTKPANNSKKGLATNVMPASKNPTGTEGLTRQSDGTTGKFGPTSGTATEDQDSMTGLDDGGDMEDGGGLDDGGDMEDGTVTGTSKQPGGAYPKMDDGEGGYSGGPKGKVKTNTGAGGTEDDQVKMDDGGIGGGGPMAQVCQLLQQAITMLQGGGGAAPAPAAPPPSPQADLTPVSGMRSKNGALTAARIEQIVLRAITPIQAELAQQKKINRVAAFNSKVDAMVLKAKQDLTGWTLDEEIEANLFKAARHGQEFLDVVVSTIQKTQPVDPMESAEQFEASLADSPEGGEVAKFMAEHPGPKQSEWVRMQAREYNAYKERFNTDMTLEQWLKANAFGEKNMLVGEKAIGARPSAETMRALMQ